MKICTKCQQEFKPSSRHLKCPKCRNAGRNRCACGNWKHNQATTCIKCVNMAGPNANNWRGGSIKHKKGYTMRWVPSHPRGTRYVFEHILVMEEMLGRYLFPDENVHHKNGVKDDNRPENLELWVKPQPAGIRAEDAVAWAREILSREYGQIFCSNNDQDK